MKHCIVNFSDFKYKNGQDRLYKSLKDFNYQGDIILLNNYQEIGSKTHQEVNYQFKVLAIEKARQMGYDVVVWCDASLYAIKDVMPVIYHTIEKGHLMEFCGFNVAQWSTDVCLNEFGITRDEAVEIPLHSSGLTGINFKNEVSSEFFKRWLDCGLKEISFHGDWNNNYKQCSQDERCLGHRHDQTTASIIAHQLNMKRINPFFMQYVYDGTIIKDETIFGCRGII
jgi:hypothetical protein